MCELGSECRAKAFPGSMIGTGHLHLCWVISHSSHKSTHRCRKSRHSHCVVLASALTFLCMYGGSLCVCTLSFCLSGFRQTGWSDGHCNCFVSARIKFKKEEKRQSHWVILTCPGGRKKPSGTIVYVPGLWGMWEHWEEWLEAPRGQGNGFHWF